MTPEQKKDLVENIIVLIICVLVFPVMVCFDLVRMNSKNGKIL